jgi:hypothetical protein
LPTLRVQVDDHAPRLIVQAKFESRLARNVLQKLGIELKKQKLIRASLQDLHLKTFYQPL